ncbi:hypothetical protein OH492_26265 [Vibrio chagasii]|nr:hypothetical protein [Vibrio chagasii]
MAFGGHKRSWKEDSILYLGGLGYGDINMTFYRLEFADLRFHHSLQMKVSSLA